MLAPTSEVMEYPVPVLLFGRCGRLLVPKRGEKSKEALPASVWVEIEAAAVDVDGALEDLPVVRAASSEPIGWSRHGLKLIGQSRGPWTRMFRNWPKGSS